MRSRMNAERRIIRGQRDGRAVELRWTTAGGAAPQTLTQAQFLVEANVQLFHAAHFVDHLSDCYDDGVRRLRHAVVRIHYDLPPTR